MTLDERARPRLPAGDDAEQRLLRRPPARRRICSANRSCASMPRPASASGISRSCTTACGTTTRPSPPNLVTIDVDGRQIDAVVQLTKQGFAFVFDRVTGKPVWPIEERPVPPSDVPGEQTCADAAVPDQAAAVHRAGRDAGRCVRSDAGAEDRGAGRR